MSTTNLSVGATTGSPITFSGLASGLDTSSIVKALMEVDREPVVRLTAEQSKFAAQQTTLGGIQADLQQLSFAAAEFALPSLFETTQTATSSEPLRVAAVTSAGAGIGGYEVEVTQLANSAQRTFSFVSPASEDKLTIDGHEFAIKAGGTAKELAGKINASSTATVYAAALENGTIVLSNRSTGGSGGEFIQLVDAGKALTEVGTAKEGKDAEFTVDGVAGTSSSNTVTTAIAGVTLTLEGLTSTGPVTINVLPPAPNVTRVEAQVQAFIKLYNSTVEAIETQLTTKPPTKGPDEAGEGTLFGDQELRGLLTSLRHSMYEPIAGLVGEVTAPTDIGLSTGAATSSGATKNAVEGLLSFEPAKLAAMMSKNPAGVSSMLEQWSGRMQSLLGAAAGPGGALEARVHGDAEQITQIATQISNMNEMLAIREKALQLSFSQMETLINQSNAAAASLTKQTEALTAQKL
jgi:flagellar hook-associated protein 2